MNPVIPAVTVTQGRHSRSVTVECPYCPLRFGKPRRHTHGWPASSIQPGHRLAHCGLGGYWIEVP